MQNQPTDENLIGRESCGCASWFDGREILFEPCEDDVHRTEHVELWAAISKSLGYVFRAELSEAESRMVMPCGCRWGIKDRVMSAFPCATPGHSEQVLAAAQTFSAKEHKELIVRRGSLQ